jgi:hypothetical protein
MVIVHLVAVRQYLSAVLHVVTMETKCRHILGYVHKRRSQRPCGLRRGSAAARLPGLWVRIPPGHQCLSLVSVVCCQIEVSTSD